MANDDSNGSNVVRLKTRDESTDPREGLNDVLDRLSLFRAKLTCADHVIQNEATTETAIRGATVLSHCLQELDSLYNDLDQAIIDVKGNTHD
jgi:hypothetical protein